MVLDWKLNVVVPPTLSQTVHEVELEQLLSTTVLNEELALRPEIMNGVAEYSPEGSVTTQQPDEIFPIVGAVPRVDPVMLALEEQVPLIASL